MKEVAGDDGRVSCEEQFVCDGSSTPMYYGRVWFPAVRNRSHDHSVRNGKKDGLYVDLAQVVPSQHPPNMDQGNEGRHV